MKLDQAKFEQGLAQQAQAANNPATAIPALIKQFNDMGVTFSRYPQQIIEEANTWIKNGGKFSDYMTNLNHLVV